jgi:ATP-dependent Clp protease ATP-binding subunit ClpA
VVLAQEEAGALGHDSIGTEHLLLGVLAERDGVAVRALQSLDLSVDELRAEVEARIDHGEPGPAADHLPFTPRAKKVLELALREALSLGHNYIGAEHILLGLIREGDGTAAKVLVGNGADLATVRREVVAVKSEVLIPRRVRARQPSQVRDALAVMSTKVDTERLVLSLLRTRGGAAARTLDSLGVLAPAVRKAGGALRAAAPSPPNAETVILGVLDDPDSAAAKVLASFGVTKEEFARRLRELRD